MMQYEIEMELDRLREINAELLAACKEALTAARLDHWQEAGEVRHAAFQTLQKAVSQAERNRRKNHDP